MVSARGHSPGLLADKPVPQTAWLKQPKPILSPSPRPEGRSQVRAGLAPSEAWRESPPPPPRCSSAGRCPRPHVACPCVSPLHLCPCGPVLSPVRHWPLHLGLTLSQKDLIPAELITSAKTCFQRKSQPEILVGRESGGYCSTQYSPIPEGSL